MSPPIRVELIGPRHRDDFVRFFDHERGPAFADNPGWAKCYCHYYHVPKTLDWDAFDGPANRIAMTARIDVGEMEGFLAYAADEVSPSLSRVVGWLNAQPLHKLPHCWGRLGIPPPAVDAPAASTAAIVCFVIAPPWRRRGVARALLRGALDAFAARGIRRVLAFPFTAGSDASPDAHYHGPHALFLETGFTATGTGPNMIVMTRALEPPASVAPPAT
ncbi:MAG: GNAT family N-acetyltransferase [Casimicrobiaceae bacterium]